MSGKYQYRSIAAGTWQDMAGLSRDAKLLRTYFLTSDHAERDGCFRCPLPYAAADLELPLADAEAALAELVARGFVMHDAGWILVRDWYAAGHNLIPNVKVAVGLVNDWLGERDTVSKRYRNRMTTVPHTIAARALIMLADALDDYLQKPDDGKLPEYRAKVEAAPNVMRAKAQELFEASSKAKIDTVPIPYPNGIDTVPPPNTSYHLPEIQEVVVNTASKSGTARASQDAETPPPPVKFSQVGDEADRNNPEVLDLGNPTTADVQDCPAADASAPTKPNVTGAGKLSEVDAGTLAEASPAEHAGPPRPEAVDGEREARPAKLPAVEPWLVQRIGEVSTKGKPAGWGTNVQDREQLDEELAYVHAIGLGAGLVEKLARPPYGGKASKIPASAIRAAVQAIKNDPACQAKAAEVAAKLAAKAAAGGSEKVSSKVSHPSVRGL